MGIEKRPMMSELFAPDDLSVMERTRAAFDPDRRLNPGKVLPGHGGQGGERTHAPVAMSGAPLRDDVQGPWT